MSKTAGLIRLHKTLLLSRMNHLADVLTVGVWECYKKTMLPMHVSLAIHVKCDIIRRDHMEKGLGSIVLGMNNQEMTYHINVPQICDVVSGLFARGKEKEAGNLVRMYEDYQRRKKNRQPGEPTCKIDCRLSRFLNLYRSYCLEPILIA